MLHTFIDKNFVDYNTSDSVEAIITTGFLSN